MQAVYQSTLQCILSKNIVVLEEINSGKLINFFQLKDPCVNDFSDFFLKSFGKSIYEFNFSWWALDNFKDFIVEDAVFLHEKVFLDSWNHHLDSQKTCIFLMTSGFRWDLANPRYTVIFFEANWVRSGQVANLLTLEIHQEPIVD